MNLKDHDIARICHEANKAYCAALCDYSHKHWEDAPDWVKDPVLQGVRFHRANPEAPAEALHENWLRAKLADGWKYGPIKDPEKKEHPCCLPFHQLPLEHKVKDYLFKAICHTLSGAGHENTSWS